MCGFPFWNVVASCGGQTSQAFQTLGIPEVLGMFLVFLSVIIIIIFRQKQNQALTNVLNCSNISSLKMIKDDFFLSFFSFFLSLSPSSPEQYHLTEPLKLQRARAPQGPTGSCESGSDFGNGWEGAKKGEDPMHFWSTCVFIIIYCTYIICKFHPYTYSILLLCFVL